MRNVYYFVPFVLIFQGCMLATQQDMIKQDEHLNKLRANQADVVTKMSELSGNLQALNSQLETSQERMTTLSQKLDDLQADIARRMNVLSGQVTGTSSPAPVSNPTDAYRIASNDYQAGKYDLAVVGFRNFVSQFPKSDMAPQAQFYIGECDYARKNYVDAAREYARVADAFPKSDFAPKALFKRGVSLQQVNNGDEAVKVLRRLIKDYPRHELAKSARDILKSSE